MVQPQKPNPDIASWDAECSEKPKKKERMWAMEWQRKKERQWKWYEWGKLVFPKMEKKKKQFEQWMQTQGMHPSANLDFWHNNLKI